MFTDTHSHYDDEAFDLDRDELLKSFSKNKIDKVISIGCDIETSKNAVELSKKYDFVYASVGFHPNYAHLYDDNAEKILMDLAKNNEKVVAWGEIGLDYHYDEPKKEIQIENFIRQIDVANKIGLPVSVHSRDAMGDTLEIVKNHRFKGVFHCYSGSVETAKELVKMGYYISFAGTVTFKNAKNLKEVAKYVPSDRYLIETDCPYLSPEPYRGKRNSSLNLIYTAQYLADLRGVDLQTVADETTKNAQELFFNKKE